MGTGRRSSCHGIVIIIVGALIALARPAAADAPPPATADQLVFVGLLPIDKGTGAPELAKLAEAQGLRATAERALADISHKPIAGHDALIDALGKSYIVSWFRCSGQLGCITALLAPLRKAGFTTAVTGDYFANGDTFHVRLFTFSIADGKIGKQVELDVPAATATDPAWWRTKMLPLAAGKSGTIKIVTDVAAATCAIDGSPCPFGEDGRTLTAPIGEHKIELTKTGYRTATVIVVVKENTDQEVDVPLQRADASQGRGARLTAVRTDKTLTIDGHLDDPAWQKAWLETNFTQHYPDEASPPTERTELRVLYDDDAIYIGIRCFDAHPDEIVSRLTRRDRDIESDKVQIDISSKNDKTTAYHFQVNAANVQLDGLRFNDSDYASDLDLIWYSATSRDALGWTAEIKIPLVALRYNGDVTSFGFQVRRVLQRRDEIDEWAFIPRSAKGEVSNYGTLEGLSDLNAVRLFQLTPYDSRRVTFYRHQGVLDGNPTGGSFGGDLKLGLTPALTLDATINPDFGTVEVDQVVLNLTNTETFFPEKRPFFLEGADLFSTPFQLFYSRRIGREPPLSDIGNPTTPIPEGQIWGAAKVSGTVAGRLSIGVMDAVSARQDTTISRGDGSPNETDLAEPLTNFAIVRLRQEFAANDSIGLLATAVDRAEPSNEMAPKAGDLCPVPYADLADAAPRNGRCTSNAYTGGIDSVLRTDDGKWGFSAQGVGSELERGPPRYIPDGTVLMPGSIGYGVTAEAGRYGGEHWLGLVRYTGASPKLDINDAGYAAMANYHDFFGSLTWRTLQPHGPFLDMSFNLSGGTNRTWDFVGKNTTRANLTATFDFTNFWALTVSAVPYFGAYDLYRETHSDALAEYPHGYLYAADIKTDTRRRAIFEVGSYVRQAVRGIEQETDATINLRPIPTLELDLLSSYYSISGYPRWIDTETNPDGARQFYFADLSSQVFSTTLRGTYTFTPYLSLQLYTQLFADQGHYGKTTTTTANGFRPVLDVTHFANSAMPSGFGDPDFTDGTININLFLRWEFLPGSALWLVYTRSQDQLAYDPAMGLPSLRVNAFDGGPSTDVLLIKLSYMWEPLRRWGAH